FLVGEFTLDPVNEARVSSLHADVQRPARQLLNLSSAVGLNLRITEGFRSFERQNQLYAQGRTAPGQQVTNARGGDSYHNYGLAIDVVQIQGGQANWNGPWGRIGEIGKAVGFEWGGDWRGFKDYPHFQMTLGH